MADFEFHINADAARKYLDQAAKLRDGSSRMRLAVSRTINRTMKHMRTVISGRIRQTYNVKKSDLDASLKIIKAGTGKNPKGGLSWSSRKSQPLVNFAAKAGKTYVSVKVLKSSRAARIQPGGKRQIAATGKGRAAVWIARGHVMARTEGGKNPIVLYGPSFMSFFNAPGVAEGLRDEAQAWFEQRLPHEVAQAMRGINNFGKG
ncbi:hypothetical protein [uncultured Desulfovibrio sp.]|uniref:hypothetical protein n=1 Tax=uncultured Desulfovibrio sp. TaxID=167968 RepID=UPI0025E70B55|nr:hypothetical protein [uncultured Desulfovibrio sp.]